jgi:hypothetical protein
VVKSWFHSPPCLAAYAHRSQVDGQSCGGASDQSPISPRACPNPSSSQSLAPTLEARSVCARSWCGALAKVAVRDKLINQSQRLKLNKALPPILIMSASTRSRGGNFSGEEVDCMLDAIEDFLPISATQWESVAEAHRY